MEIEKDRSFELAESYVLETGISVYLTGKAGTGKTTFLRNIVQNSTKRCAVVAPTGVAAINAGGVTIHSFFQLPLCPYLPDVKELVTEYQMPERFHTLRKERIKILRTLDLLIIDEISMVRADILDAIDMSLRRYRRSERPFGGVQLLMIGDIQQLPPVVTEAERQYFEQVYPSPFFFNSKAFKRLSYVVVELQKIHRQSDAMFLDILNDIRHGYPSQATLARLNTRLDPKFVPPEEEKWIRLTTHNAQADSVNRTKLEKLEGEEKVYCATVDGDFPENSYPADTELHLKVGAQVMFIRNDASGESRYYNGKIGSVVAMKPELIVEDEEGNQIVVEPEKWDNIKYELDSESNEIKDVISGSFTQYPLRLAWAITIHKSQGLTFDRVMIDAGQAFSFGQVYVALSRCRTLEGIVLASPITSRCTFANDEVSTFEESYTPESYATENLPGFRSAFYGDTLAEAFNLNVLKYLYNRLNRVYQVNLSNLYPVQAEEFKDLAEQTFERNGLKYLAETSEKFQKQLARIARTDGVDSELLKERVAKGADFYLPQLEKIASEVCPLILVEIDNKEVKKLFKEAVIEFMKELRLRLRVCRLVQLEGFSLDHYQKIKVDSEVNEESTIKAIVKSVSKLIDHGDAPSASAPSVPEHDVYKDNAHPELIPILIEWRTAKYKELGVPAYVVLSQKALLGIADMLPSNKKEFMGVNGLGKAKWEQYGKEILDLIRPFRSDLLKTSD